ncbi:hypothetical protein F2P47_07955 [Parvibaculum sedimenti]|uniref:DUF4013 domain-containing protein n=1 Tax=Parvibaculum sedimenti TaxID=2608632 RepID=A0A6N6VI26_9HYPH|nr:hypothetical protein [Parvibaculum sedimenti]KAB7740453.1 hypothetical protein F2P47_07955 [Parvibaculum sedimenti]
MSDPFLPSASPRKLDVLAAIKEAYRGAWVHFGQMLKLTWLPGLLYIALTIVAAMLDANANPALRFLLEIASLFLWPIIAVAWHRFILLGDAAPGAFHLHFGRREARFLMVSIFLGLLMLPGYIMAALTVAMNEGAANPSLSLVAFLGLIALLVAVYYFTRLLLLLPGVAVDEPIDPRLILERTRGNFWRLVLLMLLATLPIGVAFVVIGTVMLSLGLPTLIVFVLAAVFYIFFAIVGVAVLSIAYRELVGPPGTLAYDLDKPDAG